MPIELTTLDNVIIQQQLAKCTDEEIAEMIGKPLGLVTQKVYELMDVNKVVSKSQKIANKKKAKSNRSDKIEEQIKNKAQRKKNQLKREEVTRRRELSNRPDKRVFKNRTQDYSQKLLTKLDSKTWVYLDPTIDVKEFKKKYQDNLISQKESLAVKRPVNKK